VDFETYSLFIFSTSSFFAEKFSICTFNSGLGINDIFGSFFSSSGSSSSYDGQAESVPERVSVSVDEVANMVGVGMGHGGSMSVGHSRSVSVGNSGSVGIGHSGSNGSGSGVDNGSDLTDGVNETVLVVVFGESLKSDILKMNIFNHYFRPKNEHLIDLP